MIDPEIPTLPYARRQIPPRLSRWSVLLACVCGLAAGPLAAYLVFTFGCVGGTLATLLPIAAGFVIGWRSKSGAIAAKLSGVFAIAGAAHGVVVAVMSALNQRLAGSVEGPLLALTYSAIIAVLFFFFAGLAAFVARSGALVRRIIRESQPPSRTPPPDQFD